MNKGKLISGTVLLIGLTTKNKKKKNYKKKLARRISLGQKDFLCVVIKQIYYAKQIIFPDDSDKLYEKINLIKYNLIIN